MKFYKLYFLLFITLLLSACTSYKNMTYLRDLETITENEFASKIVIPSETRILQKDILSITVYTSDPEAAIPFNLLASGSSASNYSPSSQPVLQSYQVDYNGEITFPTLGKIKVAGMTLPELEDYLNEKLSKHVKEQLIVTVKLLEGTFTVVGEVGSPGTFPYTNDKLNIIKAISTAGGITNFSVIENIKILRENSNGKKEIIIVNLNDKNLIFSPNFYIQHNDIIFVEAKSTKYLQFFNQQISAYTYGLTFALSLITVILNFKK